MFWIQHLGYWKMKATFKGLQSENAGQMKKTTNTIWIKIDWQVQERPYTKNFADY